MSAPVNEIVNVQISRGSVNVSQVGFGTIMVLGVNPNFGERLQYFSDLSSVADALMGGTTDPEYLAAQAVFSQSPRCTRIALGHRRAVVTGTFGGTMAGGSISATVNGVTVTQAYSSSLAGTLTALAVLIAAIDGVATCTAGATTVVVTPDADIPVGVSITPLATNDTLTVALTTSGVEDVTDSLNAIYEYNNDWYGLILASRVVGDVEDAAAWVESAVMKVFVTASDDPDILTSGDTTSIAKLFKDAGYLKTQVRYSSKADTEYPDAALLGRLLPYDPGSYTAAFKYLSGISVDTITTTQRTAAFAKYVDLYEFVGGVNITRNGKVSGNEYLDVMIFIDWLTARCTEAVFSILVGNLKVPYTDAGIASVENSLTQPLKAGQNAGGISLTAYDTNTKAQIGGFYITVPKLQDVPTSDKTSRTLNNVKFTAFLAGAIHVVQVQGTVTL